MWINGICFIFTPFPTPFLTRPLPLSTVSLNNNKKKITDSSLIVKAWVIHLPFLPITVTWDDGEIPSLVPFRSCFCLLTGMRLYISRSRGKGSLVKQRPWTFTKLPIKSLFSVSYFMLNHCRNRSLKAKAREIKPNHCCTILFLDAAIRWVNLGRKRNHSSQKQRKHGKLGWAGIKGDHHSQFPDARMVWQMWVTCFLQCQDLHCRALAVGAPRPSSSCRRSALTNSAFTINTS